jgi:hypothetical protein
MKTLRVELIWLIGDTQGFRLLAVDRDQQLRIAGRVAGVQADQLIVLTARSDDLVSDAIQILQRIAAQILQFKSESAEVAQALNGRRFEDSHQAPRHAEKLGGQGSVDSAAEWPGPFFLRRSTDLSGTKISP